MLRLLVLALLLVVAARADCNDDSFCARRGYTFPCFPFTCPVNMTKFFEYLNRGRTRPQLFAACAKVDIRFPMRWGIWRIVDAAVNVGTIAVLAIIGHEDAEMCGFYAGPESLFTVIAFVWGPMAIVWTFYEWRRKNRMIAGKLAKQD
jgi:hypothetical protein